MQLVFKEVFAGAADHALFLVPLVALPDLHVLAEPVPCSAPKQVIAQTAEHAVGEGLVGCISAEGTQSIRYNPIA